MTKILKNNNQNTLSWGRIDHFCNILEPRNWEDLNFENFTTNLQKIIQERTIETVVFRWQLFATCKRNIGVAGCVECSFLPPAPVPGDATGGAGINSHARLSSTHEWRDDALQRDTCGLCRIYRPVCCVRAAVASRSQPSRWQPRCRRCWGPSATTAPESTVPSTASAVFKTTATQGASVWPGCCKISSSSDEKRISSKRYLLHVQYYFDARPIAIEAIQSL